MSSHIMRNGGAGKPGICLQQGGRKDIFQKELILREERGKTDILAVEAKGVTPRQKGYNKRVRGPDDVTMMAE